MQPKNLRSFLADGISPLIPQAQRLIDLRRVFATLLPSKLLQSSSIANYKQGKIVIFAENNAIAAKIRLLAPSLTDNFTKIGVEVTAIDVHVQPRNGAPARPPKHARLSLEACNQLAALSEQLPDSELKNLVASMARRGKPEG